MTKFSAINLIKYNQEFRNHDLNECDCIINSQIRFIITQNGINIKLKKNMMQKYENIYNIDQE